MRYWVHKDTVLEGWKDRAIQATNPNEQIVSLLKSEIEFLLTCDGREQDEHPAAARLLENNVITCDEKEGTEPVFDLHPYLYRIGAYLAITGRCNYSCRHCIVADGTNDSSDELSLETICSLFDQMVELGMYELWLTGGEAMIHPDFIKIVDEASKRGMYIARILTNGTFLTQEILDHFKELDQYPSFGISFDGIGTHDWMRCHEGAEELSLAAMDLATQNGFHVIPHMNVNRVTAPAIIDTCRILARDHGIKFVRLMPTSRSSRWDELAGPNEIITNDEYYAFMMEVLRANHEENWGLNIDMVHLSMIKKMEMLKNPPSVRPQIPIMHWCRRASNLFAVGHDGRVLPCMAYEGNSRQYGTLLGDDINIHKRQLKDILTESEYVDICTEKIESQLKEMEKCQSCKWVGICCGGCPVYSGYNRKRLLDENPQCDFFSHGWAEKYIALMDEINKKKPKKISLF